MTRSLGSWWQAIARSTRSSRPPPVRLRVRLCVQLLEERTLPIADTLTAAASPPVAALLDTHVGTFLSVSPTSGATDLSHLDPGLTTRVSRMLGVAQVDSYSFTITEDMGPGRLTIQVTRAGGSLVARLTLSGASGPALTTSDDGTMVRHLAPGSYRLTVAAAAGAGAYELTTEFLPATSPLDPIPAGAAPTAVAVADLNGDTRPDFVVANSQDSTVSVRLGNGDGTFGPSNPIPVDSNLTAVAVADLNRDGRSDLAVTSSDRGTVNVLLGNGDGSFGEPWAYSVGNRPSALAVADLNGDDLLDLVVANGGDNTVSVLLGNGDGTFADQASVIVGSVGGVTAVALTDLDGDTLLDLVAVNRGDNRVSVLLGRGDGSFDFRKGDPFQSAFNVGNSPQALALVDLDDDARLDLVVVNEGDNTLSVLLSNGDGSFGTQRTHAVGSRPGAVAVVDLNRDGHPDVAVANAFDNTVSILLGDGDGSLRTQRTVPVRSAPSAVTAADIDGDARPDLLIANLLSNSVSFLPGNGDGSFRTPRTFAVGTDPVAAAVADLNGDTRPDLVVANGGDDTVSVLLGNGDGGLAPQRSLAVGSAPAAVALADLNDDGKPDLVLATDALVVLFTGAVTGGTFTLSLRRATTRPLPFDASAADVRDALSELFGPGVTVSGVPGNYLLAGRFDTFGLDELTGDGSALEGNRTVDVQVTGTLDVRLGNGDGSFGPPTTLRVGRKPAAVAVADVDADGKPDLVVANSGGDDNTVSVLRGNGDGSFRNRLDDLVRDTFAVGTEPVAVAVADVDGNALSDLVVVNRGDRNVSVLRGDGNGAFGIQEVFAVGFNPRSVAVADVSGDGHSDLVVANAGDNNVSVLLGIGDGSFDTQRTYDSGATPKAVAVADVNGDGTPDIVAADNGESAVSVFLGNGDGSFRTRQPADIGFLPSAMALADLNQDGKPDIVVANQGDNTASVLLNRSGSFQEQLTFASGSGPAAVAVADLNGDALLDLVTANPSDDTVGVLLGSGPAAFRVPRTVAVGSAPSAVAVADINGDTRPDLVVANRGDDTVSVLLADGAGSWQARRTFAVGPQPDSLAVADVNGDGTPDIVAANQGDDTASVLLGAGDGSFGTPRGFAVGSRPDALAVADLGNGDGLADLVVANHDDGTVSVLLGTGAGLLNPVVTYPVGPEPVAVAVADINGDFTPDLVVANGNGTVHVLLGSSDGTFFYRNNDLSQGTFTVGSRPTGVAVADLGGDGRADIVVSNGGDGTVSVLLGNSDIQFGPARVFAVGSAPSAVAVADANGDVLPDLVVANFADNTLSVLLNHDRGTFAPNTPANSVGPRTTPYLANLSGHTDGTVDSVVLDGSGNLLFRQGLPGVGNPFAPPRPIHAMVAYDQAQTAVIRRAGVLKALPGFDLNPSTGGLEGKLTARDLTVLRNRTGLALATVDAIPDLLTLATTQEFMYGISLYAAGHDGSFTHATAFRTPLLPTRIAAADLTGDGLDDLVVANSLDRSIQIAFQQADGTFSAPRTLPTGEVPSDLALVDVDGDGLPDIVVTNQASGDVLVYRNDSDHAFGSSGRYRAGPGTSYLDATAAGPVVRSAEQSVSLAVGDFTSSGSTDLVVVNRGSHSFTVLPNNGSGGFRAPSAALTTSTSAGLRVNDQPGPVVAGRFHGPSRPVDLAILMEDTAEVWIYTGDGRGHFTHTATLPGGASPTGLAVAPGSRPGLVDLVVGNPFGDVLILRGNGNGTFQSPPDDRVGLDVILVDGQPQVVLGNAQANHVLVQSPVPGGNTFAPTQTVSAAPLTTPFAPGDVQWAMLDPVSTAPIAVVVARGSNALQLNRLDLTTGDYVATDIPVGTAPVSVTIATRAGRSVPDLFVSNQGSNDISVILGAVVDGQWVGTPGPRLRSQGFGPVSTRLVSAPGSPGGFDLAIFSQDGTVALLPGRGEGFFDDRAESVRVLTVPNGAGLAAPSFVANGPLGLATTAAGSVVAIQLDTFTARVVFTPPAGRVVNALDALATGGAVVAFNDGRVAALLENASGQLEIDNVFTALTGLLTDPSALQVIGSGDGLQVLATDAGSDQLFVFGPTIADQLGGLPAPTPVGPTTEVTAAQDSSLTLVITLLVAGEATTASPTASEDNPPTEERLAPTDEQRATVAEAELLDSGDSSEEHEATGSTDDAAVVGEDYYDEKLQQSDLIPPPPGPEPEAPELDSERRPDVGAAAPSVPTAELSECRGATDELGGGNFDYKRDALDEPRGGSPFECVQLRRLGAAVLTFLGLFGLPRGCTWSLVKSCPKPSASTGDRASNRPPFALLRGTTTFRRLRV